MSSVPRAAWLMLSGIVFEERVFFDFEDDIEIASWATVGAGLTFAGDTKTRAGVDAGGNAEFNCFFTLDATLAAAIGATLADNLASALARRACARDGEKSLLIGDLAATTAGLAAYDASSLFCAGAVAGFAIFLARKFYFCGDARRGFLEG